MEGITVLTEAAGGGLKELLILIIVFFVSVIASTLILVSVFEWLENKLNLADWIYKIITVIGVVSAICLCGFITNSCNNVLVEKSNSYKITIDDSVSFNEFNAKYKVLKQDGQIFTVVEREVEANEQCSERNTE